MSGDSKFFLGVVIAAVAVIGAVVIFSGNKNVSSDIVSIDTTAGYKLGPDDAKVKIVEFGDFQCPGCQAAAADFHQLQKDNSDVQILFRHFPLTNIHQNAEAASLAAAAAANQNKFWEYYDLVYQRQSSWANMADTTEAFTSYAAELGLDTSKFTADTKDDATIKAVKADYEYGLSLDVNQTPTFFVNGKRVVGAPSAKDWQQLLDDARK